MASKEIEKYREGAEIYHGDALCKQKTKELLKELCLPAGLLPLGNGMIEVGYNRASGFVWQRRKSSYEHFFSKIATRTKYSTEVTAFVEKYKMKKIMGVKSKRLMIWVSVTDISIDDPESKNIAFRATAGVKVSFHASAFEEEEEVESGAAVEEEKEEKSGALKT